MDSIREFPGPKSNGNPGERPPIRGGSEGQLIDFNQALQLKRLLDSSLVKPSGRAYIERFQHPKRTFTVVSLMDHFSADAIKATDGQLAMQRPGHLIIEGMGNEVPEVQYALKQAEKLGIPASDVIVPPYNSVITDLAGVRMQDALRAIIVKELPRYQEHPEMVINHLARTFNLSPAAINITVLMMTQDIQRDRKAFISRCIKTFDKLVVVSNDLSWHKLQKLNLQGDVMAIVGGEHSRIFNKDFRPSRNYTDEELNKIETDIALYESGIQAMIAPRGGAESILTALGIEQFFQELKELETHLQGNPNDEIAKQRLRNLVLPDYQERFEDQDYRNAIHRAGALHKAEIEGSEELLARALRADYDQWIARVAKSEYPDLTKMYHRNAVRRAKELQELGVEGADELVQQVKDIVTGRGWSFEDVDVALAKERERERAEEQKEKEYVESRHRQVEATPVIPEDDERDKVSRVLEGMPEIDEPLRTAITHWADNLFGLEYVRRIGYQRYLDTDDALHQVWGSAALLSETLDRAHSEGRDLSPEEIEQVRQGFRKASTTRSEEGEKYNTPRYEAQSKELAEIANGVDTLIQIANKLR